MAHCTIIAGIPRSGTSLTGGILDALGVWMGDSPMPSGPHNPKGTFNCERLEQWCGKTFVAKFPIGNECIVPAEREDELRAILLERESRGVPFGLKATRFWGAYQVVQRSLTVPVKVIFTQRDVARSIESWLSAFGGKRDLVTEYMHQAVDSLDYFRSVCPWPSITMDFDDLVSDQQSVHRIAEFVGLPITDAALAFPSSDLRRF